jgi:hypothetical protein
MLEKGLRAKRINLTVGIFPDDLLLFSPLQTFAEGAVRSHVIIFFRRRRI